MLSSNSSFKTPMKAQWLLVLNCIFLEACATLLPLSQTISASNVYATCTIHRDSEVSSPNGNDSVLILQRMVEDSLLYQVATSASKLESCHISYDMSVTKIKYQFQDGGWLQIKRDSRIELTEQEAQLVTPITENPIKILADLEFRNFGSQGCGINWQQSESQETHENITVTEKIFYGDVCNCQARIRENTDGILIGLLMRSTC